MKVNGNYRLRCFLNFRICKNTLQKKQKKQGKENRQRCYNDLQHHVFVCVVFPRQQYSHEVPSCSRCEINALVANDETTGF